MYENAYRFIKQWEKQTEKAHYLTQPKKQMSEILDLSQLPT